MGKAIKGRLVITHHYRKEVEGGLKKHLVFYFISGASANQLEELP